MRLNTPDYTSPQGFVVGGVAIAVAFAVFDQYIFRYYDVVDSGVTWRLMDLVLLLVIALFTVQWSLNRDTPRWQSPEVRPLFWALAYFMFIGSVALIRGYLSDGSYAIGMGRYTLAGGFLLLPALLLTNMHLGSLTTLFRVSIYAMICGWMVRFVPDLPRVIQALPGRYYSNVESYSAFAYAVVTIAMVAVVMAPIYSVEIKKSKQFLLAGIAFVSLGFIFLSQHRSVWFATALGCASLGWSAYRLSRRDGQAYRLVLFAIAGLIILGGVFLVYGRVIEEIAEGRLVFLTEGYEADSTGNWRIAGWMQVVTSTLENNPLFGKGFTKPELWRAPNGSWIQVWVHNEYVHYFGIAGFAGVISYILLIAASILVANRLETLASAETRLPVIIAKALMIMSTGYMVFYNQSIIFWFAIGFLLIADQLILKERHFLATYAQLPMHPDEVEEEWEV